MKEKPVNLKAAILIFLAVTISIVVLSLFTTGPSTDSALQGTLTVGQPAPDFTLPGLNGESVKLADYRGKVVLVNIWATWCPPCVEEMPSMERLYKRLKGKDFEILAVSIDTTGKEAVAPFMKKYHLSFPALLDTEGTVKTIYKTTGVPESFIIDKDGILVKRIIGPRDWTTPTILGFLDDLIKKPPQAKK